MEIKDNEVTDAAKGIDFVSILITDSYFTELLLDEALRAVENGDVLNCLDKEDKKQALEEYHKALEILMEVLKGDLSFCQRPLDSDHKYNKSLFSCLLIKDENFHVLYVDHFSRNKSFPARQSQEKDRKFTGKIRENSVRTTHTPSRTGG